MFDATWIVCVDEPSARGTIGDNREDCEASTLRNQAVRAASAEKCLPLSTARPDRPDSGGKPLREFREVLYPIRAPSEAFANGECFYDYLGGIFDRWNDHFSHVCGDRGLWKTRVPEALHTKADALLSDARFAGEVLWRDALLGVTVENRRWKPRISDGAPRDVTIVRDEIPVQSLWELNGWCRVQIEALQVSRPRVEASTNRIVDRETWRKMAIETLWNAEPLFLREDEASLFQTEDASVADQWNWWIDFLAMDEFNTAIATLPIAPRDDDFDFDGLIRHTWRLMNRLGTRLPPEPVQITNRIEALNAMRQCRDWCTDRLRSEKYEYSLASHCAKFASSENKSSANEDAILDRELSEAAERAHMCDPEDPLGLSFLSRCRDVATLYDVAGTLMRDWIETTRRGLHNIRSGGVAVDGIPAMPTTAEAEHPVLESIIQGHCPTSLDVIELAAAIGVSIPSAERRIANAANQYRKMSDALHLDRQRTFVIECLDGPVDLEGGYEASPGEDDDYALHVATDSAALIWEAHRAGLRLWVHATLDSARNVSVATANEFRILIRLLECVVREIDDGFRQHRYYGGMEFDWAGMVRFAMPWLSDEPIRYTVDEAAIEREWNEMEDYCFPAVPDLFTNTSDELLNEAYAEVPTPEQIHPHCYWPEDERRMREAEYLKVLKVAWLHATRLNCTLPPDPTGIVSASDVTNALEILEQACVAQIPVDSQTPDVNLSIDSGALAEPQHINPPKDGGVPRESKPRGMSVDDANPLVAAYLAKHPKATRDDIADALSCAGGTVSKTDVWKAMSALRKARRTSSAEVVVLNDRFEAEIAKAHTPDPTQELGRLISEQEADSEPSPLEHIGRNPRVYPVL